MGDRDQNDEILAKELQDKLIQEEKDVMLALKLQMEENENESEEEEATWFSSHLNPDRIIWSSHPEIVKPNVSCPALMRDDVVSTFFVNTPKRSRKDKKHISHESEIKRAADLLSNSAAVLIIAGAGIGVDSGLPDYRGPAGFWKSYPPLKALGLSLEEIASPEWFITDPTSSWGFYGHRAKLYRDSSPHEGFRIMKDLVEKQKGGNYFVMTSNIDSQFQTAGFDPDKIYECHGALQWLQCCIPEDCSHSVWPLAFESFPEIDEEKMKTKTDPPSCPSCRGPARPNVSLFKDTEDTFLASRAEGQKKKLQEWLKSLPKDENGENPRLVILELGCGVSCHSIRFEAEILVEDPLDRCHLVRVNPNHAEVPSGNHVSLPMGALEALRRLEPFLQDKSSKKRSPEETSETTKKMKREVEE